MDTKPKTIENDSTTKPLDEPRQTEFSALPQARAEQAFRLRAEKITWAEVGKKLGVTGQRARQLAGGHAGSLHRQAIHEEVMARLGTEPCRHLELKQFDLSIRTLNCLSQENLHSVDDLASRIQTGGWDSLLNIRDMSRKCVAEIRQELGEVVGKATLERSAELAGEDKAVDGASPAIDDKESQINKIRSKP